MQIVLTNIIKNKSAKSHGLSLRNIGLPNASMFAIDRDVVKILKDGEVQLQISFVQSQYQLIFKFPC